MAQQPDKPLSSPALPPRSRRSLRAILVIPFVIEIGLAVGLTGYFSLRDGQQAVNLVVADLQAEIRDRVKQKLTDHFETAHALNEVNRITLAQNRLDPTNLEQIAAQFYEEIQSFETAESIFWGSETGHFIGIWRPQPDQLLWMEAGPQFNGAIRFSTILPNGQRGDLVREIPNFPTRDRPWYQAAVATGQATWGEIFTYHAYPVVALPASAPVYDDDGQLLGVIGNNFFLPQLSSFLQGLSIGKTGQAFIIERSGLIVASSTLPQPFTVDEAGVTQRIAAIASDDPVIVKTTAALQANFGDLTQITTDTELELDLRGTRHFIQVSPYQDDFGLDWLVVVVLPETDFITQIQANRDRTLMLCGTALLGTLWLGLITSRWITQQLHQLIGVSKQMAAGDLNVPIQPSRIAEIQDLSLAINQMQHRLRQVLTTLEDRVTARTAELSASNQALAQELAYRHQVETALQLSESKYRAIVEDQTEFICRCQPDMTLTFVNQTFCQYLQQDITALQGQSFLNLLPPSEHDRVQQAFQSLTVDHPSADIEHTTQTASGDRGWHHWRIRGIFTAANDLVECQVIGQDITERKLAEQRLQRNAAMDRAIAVLVDQIRQTFDVEEIFAVTVQSTRTLLQCDRVAIYQFHATWNGTFVAESVNAKFSPLFDTGIETQYRDPYLQTTEGGFYKHHQTLCISDIDGERHPTVAESHLTILRLFEVKAAVIVPVFVQDRLWGLLHVYQHRTPRAWDEDEMQLLTQIGYQLGIAINQADLLVQVREHSEELRIQAATAAAEMQRQLDRQAETARAVDTVVDRTRESLDVDTIFATVTQEARHLLCCDRVVVYQFNPDWSGAFVAEAITADGKSLLVRQNQDPTLKQNISQCSLQHLGQSPYFTLQADTHIRTTHGSEFERQQSFVAHDIYNMDFSACYIQALESYSVRAYVTAPIFQGDRLWGLLAAYHSTLRNWEEWEIQAMVRLGKQLGVALKQAEYVEEIQAKSEQIVQAVQAEAAMKQAKEAADAANRAKSLFLSNMSHELRTPLHAILGFTQMLHQDPNLNLQQRDRLQIVHNSGEHLLGLINDILDLSKIEAGRMELNSATCDLHQLLHQVHQMLSAKAQAKSLSFQLEVAADVPQYVDIDAGKLRQILINIIGNAIKFTDAGQVTCAVQSRSHPVTISPNPLPQRWLQIDVQDTGPGIDPADVEQLFTPFVQTEVGKQSNEGTGLGLAISHQFAELMGGHLACSCPDTGGTIFSIQLPIQPQTADQLPLTYSRSLPISLAPNQVPPRILVVDDNKANRELMMSLLTPVGFEVRAAANGQAALDEWHQWHPHLIWMDIRMPVMDGLEATQRIRSTYLGTSTTILALTASSFDHDRQTMLDIGCNDIVSKPIRAEVIFDKMATYLGLSYCYANSRDSPSLGSEPPATVPSAIALRTSLQALPRPWLQKLHQAAISADGEQILELVQTDLAAEHQDLVNIITGWVQQYAFDELLELIEPVL